MALPEDLEVLRDRILADLNAAHDYYSDTVIAWQIVHASIAAGNTFTIRNQVTNNVTTQESLLAKTRGYLSEQLAEATFQQFFAIFETFFFDLLHLWLMAYPYNLSGKKLDFKEVLDSPDKESITNAVVNRELLSILYDRPTGWFEYLNDKLKLGCPTPNEIAQIAEAKASRDVLVHNQGIATKLYLSKSAQLARYAEGERIEIAEPYHRETWELIRKIVTDVSNAAIAKLK